MARLRPIRQHSRAGIFSLAALLFAVCADDAWATCGDYLHRGGKSLAMGNADHGMAHHSRGLAQTQQREFSRHALPRPCSGPQCRQQQPTPIAPVVPRVQLDRAQDLILSSLTDLARPTGTLLTAMSDSLFIPAVSSGRLDRPPKAWSLR